MLILASASLSRKKLLENCQIEFIQISSNFDESSIKANNISDLAKELSFQKAKSLSENFQKISLPRGFNNNSVKILGCDSIFEFQGVAFGKPLNKKEAVNRWKQMSGGFGSLHTGHTLLFSTFEVESKVPISNVWPVCREPNPPDICFHLLNASFLFNGFPKATP